METIFILGAGALSVSIKEKLLGVSNRGMMLIIELLKYSIIDFTIAYPLLHKFGYINLIASQNGHLVLHFGGKALLGNVIVACGMGIISSVIERRYTCRLETLKEGKDNEK